MVLGIEGISIHRHYRRTAVPRGKPAAYRGDDETDAAAEDFLAGRPWRFTELVPHALEDDWDVDESVDEINEERAESLGQTGRGRPPRKARDRPCMGFPVKAMTSSDGATADRDAGGDPAPVFDRRGW